MSKLKGVKSQSSEEEDLQDTIDDILDEVDQVVKSTENDLFYVTTHYINDTYSKILDEIMKETSFTNTSNYDHEEDLIWPDNQQHAGLVEADDKTVMEGKDFIHREVTCTETPSLHSKPHEISKPVASLEEVNFEPSSATLTQTKSISPQKTTACSKNQQYTSKTEENSLDKNKLDGMGIKRPILDDHHACEKIHPKKRKLDFSDEFFNEVIIQQKRSLNMDIQLARKNFRGPIGLSIPTDSITVILDTTKPVTFYEYPIKKPEYRFSRISSTKLSRAGQKISLIVYSREEYRKIRAYPYVEDCIELTDVTLTKELNEEYNKIVQGECNTEIEVEHNFLNSPNRTIQLIASGSGSSTEDSCEAKSTKKHSCKAQLQKKTEEQQHFCNFKENFQTQNNEKTLPEIQQNLWNNIYQSLRCQTVPEIQDSLPFPEIVPLQVQADVEMLNIRKNSNSKAEHFTQFFNDKNQNPILNCKSDSRVVEIKETDDFSDELLVCSSSKLTPYTSPVSRIGASLTILESDMQLTGMYTEDQENVSKTLETDDVEGENLMSAFKGKTVINNEPAFTIEKIAQNVGSEVLPLQTVELDINFKDMNALNIHPNFNSCNEDGVGNNFKQINEVDESSSLNNNKINTHGISTTTVHNGFDNESSGSSTDSNNTVSENLEHSNKYVESSLNNQNSVTFNNSILFVDKENASCNRNIEHRAVVTSKNFEELAMVAATIKNVEATVAESSDNQIIFDFSMSGLINTSEIKNENDDQVVYLPGSDSKKTISCKIDNFKERSTTKLVDEVIVNPSESHNIFLPHENYKKGYVYNQNEDIINLSDSSEYSITDNTVPYGMSNVKEENISKCPTKQHNLLHNDSIPDKSKAFTKLLFNQPDEDIISVSDSSEYSVTDNTVPYEISNVKEENISKCPTNQHNLLNNDAIPDKSKAFTKPLFNQPDEIIDLTNSSFDSVISIHSDNAICYFKEESTSKHFVDGAADIVISGSSNTSSTVGTSSNHNPLSEYSTNVKNDQEGVSDQNQIVNSVKNELLSHCRVSSGNILYEATEANNKKNSNEENLTPTTDVLDFSKNKEFTSDESILYSKLNAENFIVKSLKQIEESITSDNPMLSNASSDMVSFNNTIISENMPQSYAPPVENFDVETVRSTDVYGDSDVAISDIYVNDSSIEGTVAVATEKFGNFHEIMLDHNTNSADGGDAICTSYCGKNILPTAATFENINKYDVSITRTDVSEEVTSCINANIYPKENCSTQSVSLDYNEGMSAANVAPTVCDAENSSISVSLTAHLKEVDNLYPNHHKEEASASSLTDTLAYSDYAEVATGEEVAIANYFSGETIVLTSGPITDHPNNQNNLEGFSKHIAAETASMENNGNSIISPKSSSTEKIGKIGKYLISPSYSSSAVFDSKMEHQNNISKIHSQSVPDTSQRLENIVPVTKKILELPYVSSEIGKRPSLLNETSHYVPNLNLDDTSPTYVPTININADFVPQCNNVNLDVSQNCTITSEYLTIDEWNSNTELKTPSTKNDCDNSGKGLKISPEISDLEVQTNSPLNVTSNSNTLKKNFVVALLTSHGLLKQKTDTSTTSTSKAPIHSAHETNVDNVTTGVKRLLPSTTDNESNKRYKSSSNNNHTHQTQPSTSQNDLIVSDSLDAKEIADNNDPKWKLFNFSEPRDFFQAVRNQWCTPMPNPHTDFTRRVYSSKPTNCSKYLIPGNQEDLNIECLKAYEEQLHEVDAESINLKLALDRFGQGWNQRRIHSTLNKIKKLDNMHDMLHEAWDDAYHFYTFSNDSKSNPSPWYMSTFNKNEIARSLELLHAYDDYYGCVD